MGVWSPALCLSGVSAAVGHCERVKSTVKKKRVREKEEVLLRLEVSQVKRQVWSWRGSIPFFCSIDLIQIFLPQTLEKKEERGSSGEEEEEEEEEEGEEKKKKKQEEEEVEGEEEYDEEEFEEVSFIKIWVWFIFPRLFLMLKLMKTNADQYPIQSYW